MQSLKSYITHTNIGKLVSQLSRSENVVQGRTNIGQLVSQLSLSEIMVQGGPWGLHRVFSTFNINLITYLCCWYSRYNLDPFEDYGDDKVWEALERTYMKEKVSLCLIMFVMYLLMHLWHYIVLLPMNIEPIHHFMYTGQGSSPCLLLKQFLPTWQLSVFTPVISLWNILP